VWTPVVTLGGLCCPSGDGAGWVTFFATMVTSVVMSFDMFGMLIYIIHMTLELF
jgi:hypothetical protein